MPKNENSVTLIELILAVAFLSIIVLGINSVYYFSNFQAVNTDRRSYLQNQISILAEHMRKEIGKAVGSEILYGPSTTIGTWTIQGNKAIEVYVDSGSVASGLGTWNAVYDAGNGQWDDPANALTTDRWVAYRWTGSSPTGNNPSYAIIFCPACSSPSPNPCNSCSPNWNSSPPNIISTNISSFQIGSISWTSASWTFVSGEPLNSTGQLNSNSLVFQVKACWNPGDPAVASLPSGTVDNPCIMQNVPITMPFVTAR